jgi:hypothetical protein
MKRFYFLQTLIFAALFFVSCKKDDAPTTPVDARDKFVGTWIGTYRTQFPALSIDETTNDTTTIIKSTTNASQILVDDLVANVNGNSYTYVQYTETFEDPTIGTVVYTMNGNGTLTGSNLVQSGTLSLVAQGTTYPGSWSSNLVKQ